MKWHSPVQEKCLTLRALCQEIGALGHSSFCLWDCCAYLLSPPDHVTTVLWDNFPFLVLFL